MGNEVHTKVRVSICGSPYTIRGRDSEEHLQLVGQMVDELMQQVAAANPNLDTKRVAVLTAINMADEFRKLKTKYEQLLDLLEGQTDVAKAVK